MLQLKSLSLGMVQSQKGKNNLFINVVRKTCTSFGPWTSENAKYNCVFKLPDTGRLVKKKKIVKPMNVAVSWFDITSIFQLFQNPEHVSKAKGLNSNIIIKLKESWGSSQNPCIICDYQFACSLLLTYPLCMQDTHFSWRIDSWCYRNVKKEKVEQRGIERKTQKTKVQLIVGTRASQGTDQP